MPESWKITTAKIKTRNISARNGASRQGERSAGRAGGGRLRAQGPGREEQPQQAGRQGAGRAVHQEEPAVAVGGGEEAAERGAQRHPHVDGQAVEGVGLDPRLGRAGPGDGGAAGGAERLAHHADGEEERRRSRPATRPSRGGRSRRPSPTGSTRMTASGEMRSASQPPR